MGYTKAKRHVELDPLAKEFISKPTLPEYTERELETFGEWLEQFKVEKTIPRLGEPGVMETLRVLDTQEAMLAFGAVKKMTHLGVPTYEVILEATDFNDNGMPSAYKTPSMARRFQDKYDQYLKMTSRKNFIEARKLEDLQKLADTMSVVHNSEEVELETI